jgi:hypothetical protein
MLIYALAAAKQLLREKPLVFSKSSGIELAVLVPPPQFRPTCTNCHAPCRGLLGIEAVLTFIIWLKNGAFPPRIQQFPRQ